jgi:Ca2+-binding RTX toxin-like protein
MATFFGGSSNDSLTGGSGNGDIYGYGGNDTINAGGGANKVIGGDGADSINAGAGSDTVTNLSQSTSFHSGERIAPSNRGIQHLISRGTHGQQL